MAKRINIVIASLLIIGSIPIIAKGATKESAYTSTEKSMHDSIIIAGRFRNIADVMPRTFIINDCEISSRRGKEILEIKEDGSFIQKIQLIFPHTITVNYNRNFINAFAAPGDSIYMDIDASTSPLSVAFSGNHAEINQQYDSAFQHMSRVINSVYLPSDTVALAEYMPVFKAYVSQGRDSIDSYARKHNLSDEVISMLYADNLYTLANFACGYRGKNMEEKRAFFLDPIFDIFNEENTKVMIFPYHISAIMSYFADVRDSAPKGIVRDIMYACDEDTPLPDRSVFSNQNYYDHLCKREDPSKKISIDDLQPGSIIVFDGDEVREIPNENPVGWLIKEYNGHPIYLDISATWCGPCRAGLKGSESLREAYKNTDIKFAVLWLRSAKEDWLHLAPTISNAVQIFIDEAEVDMTNMVIKNLQINGFPTYLMIDKDGDIIKDGVPRYQSPELPEFLNRYK